MEFLNPVAGYLALLAIPIIIFYILKVRLRREVVSTTVFWEQVFDEHRTRSIWRRLRHLLSLLLNLLFLGLLVAAAVHPILTSQKQAARTVIIVDNSASMNAVEPGNTATRLEKVKSSLKSLLSGTEIGQQTAIITSGGEPRVAAGFTTHLGTLRKVVDAIEPTDYPTSNAKAISLAKSMIRGEENSEIVLFSDQTKSRVRMISNEPENPNAQGELLTNVAITKFQPRRAIGDALGYEILLEAILYGNEPIECRLEIYLDDIPVDMVPIQLTPNEPFVKIIKSVTEKGGILKASLDFSDAFATDNTALAILPPRKERKVLFYGDEDFYLYRVLQSQPNTEMSIITDCPATVPANTMLVIHKTVPNVIPEGDVFVLDPQTSSDLWELGEPIDTPIVAQQNTESPLMKFVHLTNVLLPGAKKLTFKSDISETDEDESEIGANSETVFAATPDDFPLLWGRQTPHGKTLVLTTELSRGDLALRTAFPILVSNAMMYFDGAGGELERAYTTTFPIAWRYDGNESTVVLKSPQNEKRTFPVKNAVVSFGTLPKCGIWEIESQSGQNIGRIAVNLCNANESRLLQTESSGSGLQNLYAGGVNRPIWFWLVLVALVLSCCEWFLYQRRWID